MEHEELSEAVILFLAANPDESTRVASDREYRAIKHSLLLSHGRKTCRLVSELAVRVGDLSRTLLDYRPSILHLSTHGEPSGYLLFETGDGGVQRASGDGLRELLSAHGCPVRLVMINACHSAAAAEAVSAVADHAIGFPGAVSDSAASAFSASFYRALAYGRSVSESYRVALSDIALMGLADHSKPRLFSRVQDSSMTESRLSQAENNSSSLRDEVRHSDVVLAPHRGMHRHVLVGRHLMLAEIQDLLFLPLTNKCRRVALVGAAGMGKSEVAMQICRALSEKYPYPGGIQWFDASDGLSIANWRYLPDVLQWPAHSPSTSFLQSSDHTVMLRPMRSLVILDNVSIVDSEELLMITDNERCDVIMTTRLRTDTRDDIHWIKVEPLSLGDARTLLGSLVGRPVHPRGLWDVLLMCTGGHPLAVCLAGAYLKEFPDVSPADYIDSLDRWAETIQKRTVELNWHEVTLLSQLHLLWEQLGIDIRHPWLVATYFEPFGAGELLARELGLSQEAQDYLKRLHLQDPNAGARFRLHRALRHLSRHIGSRMTHVAAQRAFVSGCERFARTLIDPTGRPLHRPRVMLLERHNLCAALDLAGRAEGSLTGMVDHLRLYARWLGSDVGDCADAQT